MSSCGHDGSDDAGAGWADLGFGPDASTESTDLLQAPRKVEKITVSYSKASKQVIVHAFAEGTVVMEQQNFQR